MDALESDEQVAYMNVIYALFEDSSFVFVVEPFLDDLETLTEDLLRVCSAGVLIFACCKANLEAETWNEREPLDSDAKFCSIRAALTFE